MQKLYIILFSILIGNICNLGFAQRNHSIPKEIKETFSAKTDTVDNQIIQYRETLICPEASDSAALVIFLHSAGGRGNDNLSHLGMPAIKLENNTPYVEYLMPFLKQYVAERPISKSKIYILGASMGAAGVWELLAENPDFFTAAIPASGAYRGKNLTPFKHTPIVCTTGTEENTFNKNKRVIGKLQQAGADATFIPLSGMRHVDACNRALSSQNLDILFSKHR